MPPLKKPIIEEAKNVFQDTTEYLGKPAGIPHIVRQNRQHRNTYNATPTNWTPEIQKATIVKIRNTILKINTIRTTKGTSNQKKYHLLALLTVNRTASRTSCALLKP
jgi:hypothetical protein